MADRYYERKSSHSDFRLGNSCDDPPNSRLFIVGSKQLTEEDFRNAFSKFGEIEEVWVVKDRNTGERKGITYIKYSKTSEAARAMEAMNGETIGNAGRQLKVLIAASRDQGSRRDSNEDEKIQRLFVIVPKNMTDAELQDHFKQFGDIEYANIIKDKETRESKGFAYIKYYRFSHAAAAYEQCDRKFKAVFAEPRSKHIKSDYHDKSYNSSTYEPVARAPPQQLPLPDIANPEGYTGLSVIAHPNINQDMLWKLFDIVPGLDYCQLRYEGRPMPVRSIGTAVYNNPIWAAYACEKFHGFEYPPGSRLIVKPDLSYRGRFNDSSRSTAVANRSSNKQPDLLQLAETIAQATSSIIQSAGLNPAEVVPGLAGTGNKETPLCNVKLPDPKPLAAINEETVARCFIVCVPHPPPGNALEDVFCRFGNLIEVYMLAHKNCGYAKYTSKESAENAIRVLHGAEVCGIRIKVLEAVERDNHRKRQRLDEDS